MKRLAILFSLAFAITTSSFLDPLTAPLRYSAAAAPSPAFASGVIPLANSPTLIPTLHSTGTPPLPLAPTPLHSRTLIGYSLYGRALTAITFPAESNPAHALVLVNGIHGDETNALPVLQNVMDDLQNGAMTLPPAIALFVIPEMNPDGVAAGQRFNANGVDLNRNWNTHDWRRDVQVAFGEWIRFGGGSKPFSEPETRAVRDWLLTLRDEFSGGVTVIYFHAAFPLHGLVTVGTHLVDGRELADTPSRLAGEVFARAAAYEYSNLWPGGYEVTGDASTWAVANRMRSLTIELPTPEPLTDSQAADLQAGIEAVINFPTEK